MDIVSKDKRSAMMRAVRSKDTAPELLVRKGLHARGLRYRVHCKHLPGRPDLVFPKWHAAVFIHGCFWHGHGCRYSRPPDTNKSFWAEKIAANVERDRANRAALEARGWRVFEIWTCRLRGAGKAGLPALLDSVARAIREGQC